MGGGGGNESGRVSIIFGPAMTEPLATGASTALAPLCQSMTGNSITAAEMSVSVVTVFVAPLSSSRFFASFLLFVLSGTEYCSAVLEWVSAFLLVFFCVLPPNCSRAHTEKTQTKQQTKESGLGGSTRRDQYPRRFTTEERARRSNASERCHRPRSHRWETADGRWPADGAVVGDP